MTDEPPVSADDTQLASPPIGSKPAFLERLDWKIALGVFALALLVRGVYLWQSSATPTFRAPVVDAMTYHFLAAKLAGKGHLMDSGYFWQPFFYPFFLAIVYFLTGTSILAAKVAGIVIGSLTCGMTYMLGRKVFGRKAGIIAGVIAALYGPAVFWEADLMGDWMATFWAVLLLLLFLYAQETKSTLVWLGIGLCGVLGILTRPTMLPFFAAACVHMGWVLYRGGKWRAVVGAARNGAAGFLMVALPVMALNHHVTKNIALLPSSGGINFYIGNSPDMCRTLLIRPGYEWEQLCAMPFDEAGIPDTEPGRQQAFYYGKVRRYIFNQPLSFLGGMGAKTLRFASSRELPRNIDIYMFRQWSPVLSALVWKVDGFGFPFGVLLPLTVAGAVLLWRRIPVVVVWLLLLLWPAAVIMVFVAGRYRLPVIPAMIVVAAGGMLALIDAARRGRWGSIAGAAACMAAAVAVATIPGPFCEEKVNFPAELGYDLGAVYYEYGNAGLGKEYFEKAAQSFSEAIRLRGDYADAYNNLGNCRALQGKSQEAIALYTRAVELNPKLVQALTNIGAIERKSGRVDQAIEALNRALAISDRSGVTHYHMAMALIQAGRGVEAVDHLKKTHELDTNPAHKLWAEMLLADIAFGQGQAGEAVKAYRDVLSRAGPASPAFKARALKGAAWILATCVNPIVRNGKEAVTMAEFAASIDPDGTTLDILAAAYAEAGRFDLAVSAAQKALAGAEKAGKSEIAADIRNRLRLYEAGQPCRSASAYKLPLP